MVFETSAKTNYGMDDMIYEIALEIDKKRDKFEELFAVRANSIDLRKSADRVNSERSKNASEDKLKQYN